MRKLTGLGVLILVLATSLSLHGMNFNETLSKHGAESNVSTSSSAKQSKASKESVKESNSNIPDYGYVRVNTSLNVRTGPWGKIIGSLYNNNKVKIIGKKGNWYKILHNGKTAYVHSWYVSSNKGSSSQGGYSSPMVKVPAKGSVQSKVVAAAKNLVSKYSRSGSFPYHRLTKGGSLGCAQVVTTALEAAGVHTGIQLGVLATIPKLKNLGWKQVKVPPYQAGDVITWKTYDRTGDGVKDNDTHIGIIMTSGNSVQAMSNSSTRKKPSLHSANYAPLCRVLRKV